MRRALTEKAKETEKSETERNEADEAECAICFESLEHEENEEAEAEANEEQTSPEDKKNQCESNSNTTKLECGHTFHDRCIGQWLARNQACPLCRNAIDCGPVIEDCIICSDEMLDAEHNGRDQVWKMSNCEHRFHRELSLSFFLFVHINVFFCKKNVSISFFTFQIVPKNQQQSPICRNDVSVPERRAINADMGRQEIFPHMNGTRLEAIRKRKRSWRNRRWQKLFCYIGSVLAFLLFGGYLGAGVVFLLTRR